jgi:hypothetical protein
MSARIPLRSLDLSDIRNRIFRVTKSIFCVTISDVRILNITPESMARKP